MTSRRRWVGPICGYMYVRVPTAQACILSQSSLPHEVFFRGQVRIPRRRFACVSIVRSGKKSLYMYIYIKKNQKKEKIYYNQPLWVIIKCIHTRDHIIIIIHTRLYDDIGSENGITTAATAASAATAFAWIEAFSVCCCLCRLSRPRYRLKNNNNINPSASTHTHTHTYYGYTYII